MKHWKALIATMLALSMLAAACGSDSDSETVDGNTDQSTGQDDGESGGSDDGDSGDTGGSDDGDSGDTGDDGDSGGSDDGDGGENTGTTVPDSGDLSLEGFTIGIATPRTQHFWDNAAFESAKAEVERLGGSVVATDGGADAAVHIENHDTFITQQVDAVITILGDDQVDAKLQEVTDAGIPVFGVDHGTGPVVNNSTSDNFSAGSANGRNVAASINGAGNIAVFNGFTDLEICRIRHENFATVIERAFPDITIVETLDDNEQPFVESARLKTLDLLQQYPEGTLDAIHVSCWDQPTIGIYEALIEEGRTEIKISGIDAGPDAVSLMLEEGSPWDVNIAQQPDVIAATAVQNVASHLAGRPIPATSFVPIIEINSKQDAAQVFQNLNYDQFVDTPPLLEDALSGSLDSSGGGSTDLSLEGFTIGIATPRTQHFWDNAAFESAKAEVERLGGSVVATDGGADAAVHIENHDTFITQQVDAVITILGDDQVDAKLQEVTDAGIPVFGVDHGTGPVVNNSTSDNFAVGLANGRNVAASINGAGNIANFNGFTDLEICRIRHEGFATVIERAFPDITIVETLDDNEQPFVESARLKTLDLLQQYPEGTLDAIHVSCWDQPTIGIYEALIEEGRTEIKISGVDAGPDAVTLMLEEGSPWDVNVAQQPDVIATTAVQNVARFLGGETIPATSFVPIIEINSKETAQAVFDQLGYAEFVDN